MRPKALLEEYLEALGVTGLNSLHDSLVLDLVEGAGGIQDLSAGFECLKCCIQELGLEPGDRVDVFEVPVFHGLGLLEPDALAGAGCIDEDTVECFREVAVETTIIIGDHDVIVPESFGVLYELSHTVTSRLVGDDDGMREMLGELGRFAARACCHIQDEEGRLVWFVSSPDTFSIRTPHPQPLSFGGEGGNDIIIKVLESFFKIIEYVFCGDPNHPYSPICYLRISNNIIFLLTRSSMNFSIYFNNQTKLIGIKVSNITPQRMLPAKFVTEKVSIPKNSPHYLLSVCEILPKFFCKCKYISWRYSLTSGDLFPLSSKRRGGWGVR